MLCNNFGLSLSPNNFKVSSILFNQVFYCKKIKSGVPFISYKNILSKYNTFISYSITTKRDCGNEF